MCIASCTYGPWCHNFCENGFLAQGCFNCDQNPPSCQLLHDLGDPTIEYDVQDTCYMLLVSYLYPKGVLFNLSLHGEVLMGIHEDLELCPVA